jgi:hypothetical protein
MSTISKDPQFIIDSNERKSKAVLHAFFPNAVEQRMEVCDVCELNKWALEIKIDDDIYGIPQYADETTRCAYKKYEAYELHGVYISQTPDFEAYKVFQHYCIAAGLWPHHVYYLTEPEHPDWIDIKEVPNYTSTLRNLIMKIRRGAYRKPLQQHKHASQHADYRVRVVAELPDISEATALAMTDDVMKLLETGVGMLMQEYPELFRSLIDKILAHLPKNKDGTVSQKQADLYEILVNWGKEP